MKFSRYTCQSLPYSCFILQLAFIRLSGDGAEGIRTPDPLLARQVLSQLSYNPGLDILLLS